MVTRKDAIISRIALFVIGGLGTAYAIWVLATTGALPFTGSDYAVRAVLPQTANLVTGARVTSAGIEVGRVTEIKRQGLGAVVSIDIDDDSVTPLPRDTVVRLRQRTPVGENFVEIVPGRSPTTVPSDHVLPTRQPDDFVELDQVLSALDGPTRRRTQELVQSLGGSLDGHGADLNRLLGGASSLVHRLAILADIGARNREQTKQIIGSAGRILAAIGERQAAVRALAEDGLTTVEAIRDRDDALSELLRVLPSTLSQVRVTAKTLGDLSVNGTPVVRELAAAVGELEAPIAALPEAASIGRSTVAELGRAITPLRGTLGEVRRLSPPTVAALPKLRRTLCEVNPMLRYIGRYRQDIAHSIANMQSSVNSYDAIGHLARVSIVTGENAVAGLPADLSKSLLALSHTGFLSPLQGLELEPYPKPGAVGRRGVAENAPLTPEDLASRAEHRFERVHAEC